MSLKFKFIPRVCADCPYFRRGTLPRRGPPGGLCVHRGQSMDVLGEAYRPGPPPEECPLRATASVYGDKFNVYYRLGTAGHGRVLIGFWSEDARTAFGLAVLLHPEIVQDPRLDYFYVACDRVSLYGTGFDRRGRQDYIKTRLPLDGAPLGTDGVTCDACGMGYAWGSTEAGEHQEGCPLRHNANEKEEEES